MAARDMTRRVNVGSVAVGGGAPVSVQSMTNTDTHDAEATIAQIKRLEALGCEIVRATFNDEQCAAPFRAIRDGINIPLVADIHFSAALAVLAAENGADKLRINPGNIGSEQRVRMVADAARAHGIPIRIGVNTGSIKREKVRESGVCVKTLVDSALEECELLERVGFEDIVISIKASNVPMCVEAYESISALTSYPLHIGITEAGVGENAVIKSAAGIGALLLRGIGDTLRVSLSGPPEAEVETAYSLLRACGLRQRGVEVIACPTCGRTRIDVSGIARRVEESTRHIKKHIKAAVMGCAVNGPGEGREADVGVAGGDGFGVVFRHGVTIRKVEEACLSQCLIEEITKLADE